MNGFVNWLLRYKTLLRTLQMPLVVIHHIMYMLNSWLAQILLYGNRNFKYTNDGIWMQAQGLVYIKYSAYYFVV